MVIIWPEFKFPPINLWVLSTLSFNNVQEKESEKLSTKTTDDKQLIIKSILRNRNSSYNNFS